MMRSQRTAAIVVAAGSAQRYGGRPKLLEPIGDRPVVVWSVQQAVAAVDEVIVVCEGAVEATVREWFPQVQTVGGGVTRSDSVRQGLSCVDSSAEIIAVHDAARPAATATLWRTLVDAVIEGADIDGAVPAVSVVDSLKQLDGDGHIRSSVNREETVSVQTPQVFRARVLRRAYASAHDETDDAGIVERIGGVVCTVAGEATNRKLTHVDDLPHLEAFLAPNETVEKSLVPTMRVGFGFDTHRVRDDRTLTLGGVTIPDEPGLDGHSDADVVVHAAVDAVLGACGFGDIGMHFSDEDLQWKDAPSRRFATEVREMAVRNGFELNNIDVTVIAEGSKIGPYRSEMRAELVDMFGCAVNVKATRPEKLGALGRNEGIAATAVALVMQSHDPGASSRKVEEVR